MADARDHDPCTKEGAFDAGLRIMRAWQAIGVDAHRRFYVLRHGGRGGMRWQPVASPAAEAKARAAHAAELERAQLGAVATFGRGGIMLFSYVTKSK